MEFVACLGSNSLKPQPLRLGLVYGYSVSRGLRESELHAFLNILIASKKDYHRGSGFHQEAENSAFEAVLYLFFFSI